METKKNIFKEHLAAWLTADRKEKGELIKHIRAVAKVHPKSIPRSFRRIQMGDPDKAGHRGRKRTYGNEVTAALKEISEAANHPCGENLHGLIEDYVAIFKRDGMWTYDEATTKLLLAMSVGTVKRRALKFSRIRKMAKGKSTTKPGSIKSLIPVRSGPWDDAPVGTMQLDTVAHCGATVAGDYVFTVNGTDVATLWGERRAQWNKGQEQTVASIKAMDEQAPFDIQEWHPDTGSEFINWFCKGFVEARGQKLTRSRPNHKNDNCFVEERNGHIVRAWVGYARFEEPEVVGALNLLYDVLTPYLNHFAASKRTVSKERIGSKWKVTREKKSLTPYARIMARKDVSDEVKAKLRAEHERLNPLTLKKEIDVRLARVFDIHKRYGKPKV